jgi:hypothetical protein
VSPNIASADAFAAALTSFADAEACSKVAAGHLNEQEHEEGPRARAEEAIVDADRTGAGGRDHHRAPSCLARRVPPAEIAAQERDGEDDAEQDRHQSAKSLRRDLRGYPGA